jgi:flagellar operon protein
MDRMDRRNITLNPDEMARLQGAIDRAEKSGMKESLVILDQNALIVSVPNRTVITAMDRSSMRDNLVTHIDSAVLL